MSNQTEAKTKPKRMGGRTHLRNTISRTGYQIMNAMSLNIAVTASAKFLSVVTSSGQLNVNKNEKELKTFNNFLQSESAIYVGGRPPKSGNWIDWQTTVQNSSAPIQYKLTPIPNLFTRVFFANYTRDQLKDLTDRFVGAVQKYCESLGCKQPYSGKTAAPPKISFDVLRSNFYGNKEGGKLFREELPKNPMQNVRRVLVKAGAWIYSLRFWVSDGINSFYTAAHGGNGRGCRTTVKRKRRITTCNTRKDGQDIDWEVPENEFITQVEVYSSEFINGLT